MTDPTPAAAASRRKLLLFGLGGAVTAALVAVLVIQGLRSDAHSEGEAHGHAHEGPAGAGEKPAKHAASEEVLRHADRAARAAAVGHLEQARTELAALRTLSPEYAPGLLIQACVGLEAGNDAEADAALKALEAKVPNSREVKLLQKVRELRRTPGTGWQQAFRQAWVALGRPDFQKSRLLPGATPLPPDPTLAEAEQAAWTRATSDEVKLLLALGARRLDADKALFLLGQLPKVEDPFLYVAIMDALRGDALPESSHAEARKVFRQTLERLAAAHPRAMNLQLLLLLGDTEQGSPMSAAELDALEKVAALPVWRESSYAEQFQRARRVLKDAGVPDASAMAMSATARGVTDRGTWILRTRNVGTRGELSPEGRKRLGRITRDIGTRMLEQPTMMERMTGLQLVRSGVQDMADEAGTTLALAQLDALEKAIEQFRKTELARWPLHSLTEELLEQNTKDEPAYLLSFVGDAPAQAADAQP
jgi:hypothetical protein